MAAQVTLANSTLTKTAALPKSFAFLDKGCRSNEMRSTTASIAELSNSTISIRASTNISTNFSRVETGSSIAMQTAGIDNSSSCLNACSDLQASFSP